MRAYPFCLGGDAGGYTQAGARRTGGADVGNEAGIAVGRFDEQLGLVFGVRAGIELLQALGAVGAVDGQLAV